MLANRVAVLELAVEDQKLVRPVLGRVRGPQVVELQAEGGHQPAKLNMPGVDELPAVLGHLSSGEGPRAPAPAADTVPRLVEVRVDTVQLQLVRTGDPG